MVLFICPGLIITLAVTVPVGGDTGLPPKKESSFDVRLELKIKGVNHGQEIAFSRANHQQAARS